VLLELPTSKLAQASGESYLELAALDLDDPAAIVDFANRHRRLEALACWPPRFRTTVDRALFEGKLFRSVVIEEGEPLTVPAVPYEPVVDPVAYLSEWDDGHYAAAVMERILRQKAEDQSWIWGFETVEAFRLGAYSLRDAIKAWRVLRGEVEADSLEWEGAPEGPGQDWPRGRHDAAALLQVVLEAGLEAMYPRVDVFAEAPAGDEGGIDVSYNIGFARQPPFFAICCLELFNHIAEGAAYLTCANETCHRLFVRQSGRAQHGQHRLRGVLYCSPSCAKATAQRRYLARKRANERREQK
jgi:hypothetical protein